MRTTGKATDLITFSRSSGGTALRKIGYGPELVTNGTFDTDTSGWSIDTARGTISWQSGVLRVTNDQATGFPSAYQLISGLTVGKVYRMSSSVRGTNARLRVTSTAIDIYSASNITSASFVQDSVVFVATATTATVYAYCNEGGNTGNYAEFDNISVKEVLFDQGDLTLFNHPADIPRIEYDANGNVLGLLVEEARTNLVTYSEDFTDASWITGGLSSATSSNTALSPDGTLNADTISDDGLGGTVTLIGIAKTVTVSTSTAYTASVFAKAAGSNFLSIATVAFTTPANGKVWFDLVNGTVGTSDAGLSGSIEDFGSGWYRCSITFTTDAADTSGQVRFYLDNADGGSTITRDGTNSIYVYGAQFEAGAFPTSYIPTSGSTATRAADVASIATSEFGYRDDEGTVLLELTTAYPANLTNAFAWQATDGTTSNRIDINQGGSGDTWPRVLALFRTNNVTTGQLLCQAVGWESNNQDVEKIGLAYKDSGSVLDTTGDSSPALLTAEVAKNITTVSLAHRGHYKSIKYIPRRLTNDQLVEITS